MLSFRLSLPGKPRLVGEFPQRGVAYQLGPLRIESYATADEPQVTKKTSHWPRLLLWETHAHKAVPGWHPTPSFLGGQSIAVAPVYTDYMRDWKGNAQRHANKHRRSGTKLKRVTLTEFTKEYHASGMVDPITRRGFLRVVDQHQRMHGKDVAILFAHSKEGTLLGGVVFVDFPDISQSVYLISFLTEVGRKSAAGYAYIDWWYQDMLKKGLHWANFGVMWSKGDPKSWQGYSRFKERFSPIVLTKVKFWRFG